MSFHAWSTKIDLGILGEVAGIVEGEIIGTDECMTTKILKVSIFNGKGWLDAHKKILFAELFRKSEGKNVAEREANVYASQDWINFAKGHAEKEAEYNRAKREYELKLKAYDAEHLTLKNEVPAIRRSS